MNPVGAAREVAEERGEGDVPLWVQPEWASRFPWLVQGTTGRGADSGTFDLGLSGATPVGPVMARWRALQEAMAMRSAAHSWQVHGAELWVHRGSPAPGLLVMRGFDGHLTDAPGLLVSVSVADCVPVSLVDPDARAAALLHAGWRGVAAGILERAVGAMREAFGTRAESLWLHCGPSICEVCYEVGPEVHRAVRPGIEAPGEPTPIDLRAALLDRAATVGLEWERCTASAHCTRCGGAAGVERPFFSHRAGEPGRQMGLLGIRS